MTLYEMLSVIDRMDRAIQIGYNGKNSGIMKAGNITYKQLDHYCYKKHVSHIVPCIKQNHKLIYIQLVDD